MNARELADKTLVAACDAELSGFTKTAEALVLIAAATLGIEFRYDPDDPEQLRSLRRSLTPQALTNC